MSEIGKIVTKQISKIFSRKAGTVIADKVSHVSSLKELELNTSFEYELRPPRAQSVGSWVFVMLGVVGIVFGFIYLSEGTFDPANNGMALWLGIASFLMGVFLYIHAKTTYVKLSNSFINARTNILKPELELRYTDITLVKFSEKKFITIYKGKQKFNIYLGYKGSSVIYPLLISKCELSVYGLELITNDFYYNQFTAFLNEEEKEVFIHNLRELYQNSKK